jgi:polysaccharide biosynthesis/export protein
MPRYASAIARTLFLASTLTLVACASTVNSGGTVVDDVAGNSRQPSASHASTPSEAETVPGGQDYLIGPGDLLKIEVFRVDDLSREVRVNANGQIALPLIGLMKAAGLTGEQLASDISARLSKEYLQNPQVIVFIQEYTSQRVTVVGAVKKPGVYPLKGTTTLMQVVATAEGPTSVANIGSVKVLRPEPDGTRKMMEFNLADIRDGRIPDPEIRGEDVVQVDASTVKDTVKQAFEFVLPFWVLGTVL